MALLLNISSNDIYKISAKLYKVILIAVVCFFYLLYARKYFICNKYITINYSSEGIYRCFFGFA